MDSKVLVTKYKELSLFSLQLHVISVFKCQ